MLSRKIRSSIFGISEDGSLIDDDFTSYATGTLIDGYTPPINVGTAYQKRFGFSTISNDGTSPNVDAADTMGGSFVGVGIDALQPNIRLTAVVYSVTNADRLFVGGDAVPNGNYPSYTVRLVGGVGVFRVYNSSNTEIAEISVPTVFGTKVSLEFIPNTRFTVLYDDVVKYELTSGVASDVGSYCGYQAAGGRISRLLVESL